MSDATVSRDRTAEQAHEQSLCSTFLQPWGVDHNDPITHKAKKPLPCNNYRGEPEYWGICKEVSVLTR